MSQPDHKTDTRSVGIRILDVNRRWSTLTVRWALSLSVFLAALAGGIAHTHWRHSLSAPPAVDGDAIAYDSLGWELAHGRGFQIDYRNPDLQQPYRDAAAPAPVHFPDEQHAGPTTSRPPLLPLVMAGLDRLLGRQFWGIRVINIAAMSATAGMVVWTVCRICGPLPALLGAFNFLLIDWRVRAYARDVLTESLACLVIALLALLLLKAAKHRTIPPLLAAGGVFGLAILLRTMFVLWLPVLLALVLGLDGWRNTAWRSRSSLRRSAAFLAAALLVPFPWFIRNCVLLDRFMPLGAQGTIELSAAYSDEGFRRMGMWFNQQQAGVFHDVVTPEMTTLDRELAMADAARTRSLDWVLSNPHKTALLPFLRFLQEFRPHGPGELYVLAFAILGLLMLRGRIEGRVLLFLLAAAAFGVACTWSTAGRFVVPVLFVLHAAAAIGLWSALIACTLRRDNLQILAGMSGAEINGDPPDQQSAAVKRGSN